MQLFNKILVKKLLKHRLRGWFQNNYILTYKKLELYNLPPFYSGLYNTDQTFRGNLGNSQGKDIHGEKLCGIKKFFEEDSTSYEVSDSNKNMMQLR